jgi:hypothetical protein
MHDGHVGFIFVVEILKQVEIPTRAAGSSNKGAMNKAAASQHHNVDLLSLLFLLDFFDFAETLSNPDPQPEKVANT